MASTYTTNLGIEKIATGEQSGTWGATTNTNLDLIDQAVNGVVQITVAATGSTGSPNALTISNGSASDGRNKFIDFYSPTDLGGTVYYQLDPNDAEKIVFVRNSLGGGQTLVLFQGTYNASNDVEVPNGVDMLVKFDGTGASATVTNVFEKLQVNALSVNDGNITNVGDIALDSISADGTDINVSVSDNSATALTVKEGSNTYLTIDTTNSAEKVLVSKTLDIGDNNITNVGNIALDSISADGTQIDIDITDNTASAFTISEGANNYIAITTTDGSELITVSKNSTFAGTTIADLGVVTTVDINGGTIDGVTIGGASAGAGTFTTITGSGDMAIDTDTLFVDVSENQVGIGTDSPASSLHVDDVESFPITLTRNGGSDSNTAIRWKQATTSWYAGVNASNSFAFKYNSSDLSSGNDLVITSSGDVGIGTVSPATKLVLAGDNAALAENNTLRFWDTDTSTEANQQIGKIEFFSSDSSSPGASVKAYIGAFAEDTTPDAYLAFATDSSTGTPIERLRITSTGNLGLSVTPSAWGSLFKALQVGRASLFSNISAGDYGIYANSFSDGTDDIYIGSTGAGKYKFNTTSRAHQWFTAASGTAGNAITFTQAMTLDASGNLGIGTTSPAALLEIAKDDRANGATLRITNSAASSSWISGDIVGTIDFYASDSSDADVRSRIQSVSTGGATSPGSVDLTFSTFSSSTLAEAMRITSAGNVGIGTTSPDAELHIEDATGNAVVQIESSATGYSAVFFGDVNDGDVGQIRYDHSDNSMRFGTNATAAVMRIDSSGNLLVGKTSQTGTGAGIELEADGTFYVGKTGDVATFNRTTSVEGTLIDFQKQGLAVGSIASVAAGMAFFATGVNNCGWHLSDNSAMFPMKDSALSDGLVDLGGTNNRFDDIYATNATIQTSDRNEKQDIEALSEAEQRVAVTCKGLLRKFRWKSKVEEKGDDARIHFGIIAQDLQAAFEAEGLDAGRYAMFIHSTWTDEETGEERSRMGVRYSELLAFIIAAI
jgi:hypothetical protein